VGPFGTLTRTQSAGMSDRRTGARLVAGLSPLWPTIRTVIADALLKMAGEPDLEVLGATGAVLDGADERLLRWVDETGLVALIADNYAVEAAPGRAREGRHPFLPLHELCLFKLGIHLGELWYLTELAGWLRQAGRSRFLLTAPPLRLPGAVGSPVATV
jgi:hypothetical protein